MMLRDHAIIASIGITPRRLVGWIVLAVIALSTTAAADSITLRDSTTIVQGRITSIDAAGVSLQRDDDSSPVLYRWDRVREVSASGRDAEIQKYRADAVDLWRARSRLERHDAALAEDLLARLFEKYRGQTHETALVVAEGLLRCRLARAAHESAVIAALETTRLRRASESETKVDVYQALPAIMDERTQLCTVLPPVWIASQELLRLERELREYDARNDAVVASMAQLYHIAVQVQLGMKVDQPPSIAAADHEGVALLQSIIEMLTADADRRHTLRQAVLRDMTGEQVPHWQQAWGHYFIGVSLLNESGAGRNELGLVHLAHLPARFGSQQPYLAGLALAKLAESCDAAGQSQAADSLRSELDTRFPNHPILMHSRRAAGAVKPSRTLSRQTPEDQRDHT